MDIGNYGTPREFAYELLENFDFNDEDKYTDLELMNTLAINNIVYFHTAIDSIEEIISNNMLDKDEVEYFNERKDEAITLLKELILIQEITYFDSKVISEEEIKIAVSIIWTMADNAIRNNLPYNLVNTLSEMEEAVQAINNSKC